MATPKSFRPADFLLYWLMPEEAANGLSALDQLREHIAEMEAEYGSEAALFGDGPPGSAIKLREAKAKLAKIERQVERLARIAAKE
jgi:hypothetical protein